MNPLSEEKEQLQINLKENASNKHLLFVSLIFLVAFAFLEYHHIELMAKYLLLAVSIPMIAVAVLRAVYNFTNDLMDSK